MNTFSKIYPNGAFVPYFIDGTPTSKTADWLAKNSIPVAAYGEIANLEPRQLAQYKVREWACLTASVNRIGRTEYRAYLRGHWIEHAFNIAFSGEIAGENAISYKELFA